MKVAASGLDTGHDEIDREHHALGAMIARIERFCDSEGREGCAQCPRQKIDTCLAALLDVYTELMDYMMRHFRYEKSLMKQLPSALRSDHCDPHIDDHSRIASRLNQVIASPDHVDPILRAREVKALLEDWLATHIAGHDMPLVGHLRQHGVLATASCRAG